MAPHQDADNDSDATEPPKGTVTITQNKYEEFRQWASMKRKVLKQLEDAKKKDQDNSTLLSHKDDEIRSLTKENDDLAKRNDQAKKMIKDLNDKIQELNGAAAIMANAKSVEEQRTDDITNKVKDFAFEVTFRNHKFFDLKNFPHVLEEETKKAWPYVQRKCPGLTESDPDLDEAKFVALYKGVIYSEVGTKRTYVQSQAKVAAHGTFNFSY